MPSNVARRLPRLTVIGALALTLALAACGRKGPLDPPPASVAGPDYPAAAQPAPGQPAPDGRPVAAPGTKKRLPIDWLLD